VGGDLVEVHDDAVWVNGVKLNEPYVFDGQPTTPLNAQSSWRVPKDRLFVLGDHREASQDSRIFGPIAKSTVIGRAWLRYWPIGKVSLIGSASYQGVPDFAPRDLPTASPAPSN
jgi:signal peptidase I